MSGDWSSDVCSSDLFPSHDISLPIESYITYITHHLQQAIASISSTPDTQKAIEHIHKITALGIKCMQDNGTYIRTGTLTTNQRNHQTYDYSQLDINQ